MGYYYEIQYRHGKENMAADGQSSLFGVKLFTLSLSTISYDFIAVIMAS